MAAAAVLATAGCSSPEIQPNADTVDDAVPTSESDDLLLTDAELTSLDGYAGVHFDSAIGQFVVSVTPEAYASATALLAADADASVVLREVPYSLVELRRVEAEIASGATLPEGTVVVFVGVSIERNQVQVGLAEDSLALASEFLDARYGPRVAISAATLPEADMGSSA